MLDVPNIVQNLHHLLPDQMNYLAISTVVIYFKMLTPQNQLKWIQIGVRLKICFVLQTCNMFTCESVTNHSGNNSLKNPEEGQWSPKNIVHNG